MAYLKMDVDDLGWVFSQGLKGAKEDHTSISRVATLSRALELFFSGWLERALREEFQDVYLVYSGGDDVLAIGPWNVMFNLAGRIRSEFRRFTADNPLWTLSAGLALARVHTPVLTAVEEAEKNLEASKDIKGSGVLPWPLSPKVQTGQREKDRITAWNTSIPWARYEDTLGQAKKLLKWLEDQVLTTGQVRRLRAYAEMWREYVWKRDTRYLQYAPLLVRDLKRTWKEDTAEQREAKQWAAGLAAWPVTRELDGLFFVSQYALNGVRAKAEKEETGGAA
jgi:CRISPR-associated protein Csm1